MIKIMLIFRFENRNREEYNIAISEERLMKNNVKMFTLSTCIHCKNTKKFLDECKVGYDFVNVDLLTGSEREAVLEEVKRLNPECSFPTIIIGNKVIVGFKKDEIKRALGL